MVSPADLRTTEPRWHTRRITAAEVLRLSRGEDVPGVTIQDPRVQGIRRCRLTNYGRLAVAEALRQGYLYVQLPLYEPQVAHNLRTLWGWWCAAAGHLAIVLSTTRGRWCPHPVRSLADRAELGLRRLPDNRAAAG